MSAKINGKRLLDGCFQQQAGLVAQGEEIKAKTNNCAQDLKTCEAFNKALKAQIVSLDDRKSRLETKQNEFGMAVGGAFVLSFAASFWLFKN